MPETRLDFPPKHEEFFSRGKLFLEQYLPTLELPLVCLGILTEFGLQLLRLAVEFSLVFFERSVSEILRDARGDNAGSPKNRERLAEKLPNVGRRDIHFTTSLIRYLIKSISNPS